MPENLIQIFLKVFSRLPQQIIWKWETDENKPQNLPSNIVTEKWLPQQDLLGIIINPFVIHLIYIIESLIITKILGHPNARLFISHGGLLGLQEAIYHGVPVLGLPFANDQKTNIVKAEKEGYLLKLDWDKITEEILCDTIQKLINEPR